MLVRLCGWDARSLSPMRHGTSHVAVIFRSFGESSKNKVTINQVVDGLVPA